MLRFMTSPDVCVHHNCRLPFSLSPSPRQSWYDATLRTWTLAVSPVACFTSYKFCAHDSFFPQAEELRSYFSILPI